MKTATHDALTALALAPMTLAALRATLACSNDNGGDTRGAGLLLALDARPNAAPGFYSHGFASVCARAGFDAALAWLSQNRRFA